jgi:Tol biopolymer transport system component
VTFPIWAPDSRSIVATHGAENAGRFDLSLPLAQRRFVPLPAQGSGLLRLSPSTWSPDGALLGGETVPKGAGSAAAGIGVYRIATGEYVRLTTSGKTPAWLNDSRTLLYTDDGKIMAVDALSRRVQTVLEPGLNADFTGVVPSPDGRYLYALRATHEGDIWLLTLR